MAIANILLLGAIVSQPFYVISMHVMNARYNQSGSGLTYEHKKAPCRNSYQAYKYILRTHGTRGFYRGLLPTTLFSTIVLWDSLKLTLFASQD
mmetsp:Transcript_36723/g.48209  ORF Transcript_36723/g.48209 Transcript_36723/m.48209 type:complete len:93 (-) Transcript_36723:107-385(-)